MIIISNVGGGCKLSGKRPVTENLLQVFKIEISNSGSPCNGMDFWEKMPFLSDFR